MLLGVVLEKIYGEPFETILAREIEKPLTMGSGTQPPAKLLAQGYTKENEELPPFSAPMHIRVRLAALQHARICCGMRPGSWWNAMRR